MITKNNDGTINIPITFLADSKGYYDRKCPNKNCEFVFKLNVDDWKKKNKNDEVYCPMCGHCSPAKNWCTIEQMSAMKKIAINWAKNYIQDSLNQSFKRLESNSNKYIKITYTPSIPISFTNSPIGQRPEWEIEIICEKCQTRFSVIGSAFFCPSCGYNSIENMIDNSLQTIENKINSIDNIRSALIISNTSDEIENITRCLIEISLSEIVSSYQKYAKSFFDNCDIKVRANDFQIIDKGSELFRKYFNIDYDKILNDVEIDYLKIMFQKRHLIEHNAGIVDEYYLNNVNNHNSKLNERIIIKPEDILKFNKIIKKLCNGLKQNIVK